MRRVEHYAPMVGHLAMDGQVIQRAGFLPPNLGAAGLEVGPSIPILSRGQNLPEMSADLRERLTRISEVKDLQRAEAAGDITQVLFQLGQTMAEFQRNITSTMTAFPVRENLEAEAKLLVPVDTPVRNKLARTPGAGTASAWRQATSLGGGWAAGDQPGEGPGAVRAFFAETGAPAEHTTVYAAKSASYKLLGTYGSVTGFAMATGANFQNQLATEKANAIRNLMLNEENALINGDATSTAAPWGDGSNALAFNGLVNLITTANGVPSAQVQTAVGALTTAHIDAQLTRIWKQGGQRPYILMNSQEVLSLVTLAEANGSIIRVMAAADNGVIMGVSVTGYKHPITGEIVPIIVSKFLAAGTILFGSEALPDGSPAADVNVLPQVQLPELAPNTMVQGYTAQELAPTTAAPQVYPFIVTVYEVLRMKGATVFAKSTGVTAVT